MTTLPRLILATAIRSLTTRLEQRLAPIVSTIVGAVGFVSEGRWDADFILAVPAAVGEVGARVSGLVAGCGCTDDNEMRCSGYGIDYCPCGCHTAADRMQDLRRMVSFNMRRAREALAARPEPEADDIDDDDDWLDYGVTAPGGCS